MELTAGALGAVVGMVLALTGAGGGMLAVPLLVFGLHLPIAQAGPVGLMAVGAAAAVGAALGWRDGLVRYRAAAFIGAVGMVSAPVGVWLTQRLPNPPLMIGFALVLVWTAGRMAGIHAPRRAASAPSARPCLRSADDGRLVWTGRCAWRLGLTGAASGLLSGLLGVGGGFVIVPALSAGTDLSPRSILATSLAVIALVSVGGVVAATAHGAVAWPIALPFAVGAMAALLAGRRLAARAGGIRLQRAFAAVALVVAVLMVARAFGVAVH